MTQLKTLIEEPVIVICRGREDGGGWVSWRSETCSGLRSFKVTTVRVSGAYEESRVGTYRVGSSARVVGLTVWDPSS